MEQSLDLNSQNSTQSNSMVKSVRLCRFSQSMILEEEEMKKQGDIEFKKLEIINTSQICACCPRRLEIEKKNQYNIYMVAKLGDDEAVQALFQCIDAFLVTESVFYTDKGTLKKLNEIVDQHNDTGKYDAAITKEFIELKHEMIIDLIVTVGGDGTILYTVSHFQNRKVPPIFAIEKGTLGFMCMYKIDSINQDVSRVLEAISQQGSVMVEKKMRLRALIRDIETKEKIFECHSLNEIVIDRGISSSCIKVDLYINEHYLTTCNGDGLIFSTPTGSTAYSLSAGGPIVQNDVRSITLCPICPHSLSFRPMVVPECAKIQIQLAKDARIDAHITGDGQKSFMIKKGQELLIEQSEYDVPVIRETYNLNVFSEWADKLKLLLNWNNTEFNKNALKEKHYESKL